jgi:hypothetical protein
MEGVTLLAEARAAGLVVRVSEDGTMLHIKGPHAAAPLVEQLRVHKPAILDALKREEEAVAWRVVEMRKQIPPRGPIPLLRARPSALEVDAPGACLSCGAPVGEGQHYRCRLCREAAWEALNQVREGKV